MSSPISAPVAPYKHGKIPNLVYNFNSGAAIRGIRHMPANRNSTRERRIHLAFEISLGLKGLFAVGEIIGGAVALFVSRGFLLRTVSVLTAEELTEDPRDLVANYLLHSAQSLTTGTQIFVALYLLSHGAIKLWLVIGLLRERLWYYPTAMVVFALFIVYQLHRFTFTHSAWLVMVTAVDIVVVALTWHEYGYLRRIFRRRT
jgi:uncharacterized membrane protein